MSVQFSDPIARAWNRMVEILFSPFSLEKWIVIGFAAWLAGLASGGPGGGVAWTGDLDDDDDWGSYTLEADPDRTVSVLDLGSLGAETGAAVASSLRRIERWFEDFQGWKPLVVGCVLLLVVVAMALFVLVLWLSSRGIFVFLDDVIRNEGRIAVPWRSYSRLGDSLFLWRLLFTVVVLAVAVIWVFGAVVLATPPGGPLLLVFWVMPLVAFIIAAVYVDLFLRHFVAPVMYKHDLGATAAWGRFLALFRAHPVAFLVYGLLLLGLWIGTGFAVLAAGILTCCVGFLLLAIPYIGTVLLLPVYVFFRQLSLEFLRQFGGDYDLLLEAGPEAGEPQPEAV